MGKIKELLAGAVSKINPRALLVNLGKNLAIKVAQQEGDRLQAEVKLAVEEKGPSAVDEKIDRAQRRIIALIEARVPEKMLWFSFRPLKAKLAEDVQKWGDQLQDMLKKALALKAPGAVDAAFDAAQSALIERIKNLKI